MADYDKFVQGIEAERKVMKSARPKLEDLSKAKKEKRWNRALGDLDEVKKLLPEACSAAMQPQLDRDRFEILLGKKDLPAACELAVKMSEAHKDDSILQNLLAQMILAANSVKKPELDVVELLVNRANEATKGCDANVLDTQARLLFVKGQKEEAIETQTKAVALALPFDQKAMQTRLDSYKKGELPQAN